MGAWATALAVVAGLALGASTSANAQPTPYHAQTNATGDRLFILFPQRLSNMDVSTNPSADDYGITVKNGDTALSSVQMQGVTDDIVSLRIPSNTPSNATLTVSYAKPSDATKRLKSHGSSTEVASFTDLAVANIIGKALSRATRISIDPAGNAILLLFSEDMNTSFVPVWSAFTLTGTFATVGTRIAYLADRLLRLPLSQTIPDDATVTIRYLRPSSASSLRDANGGVMDTWSRAYTVATTRFNSPGSPAINDVRVVSAPTHDSDGDGVFDTYVKDDEIVIDVGFSQPVEVKTDHASSKVLLALDVGTDDDDLTNSGKEIELDSVRYGGTVLRFVYTVDGGNGDACSTTTTTADCDDDGVWVQSSTTSNQVVHLHGTTLGTTIKNPDTGVDALLTMAGLPTSGGQLPGAERARVDGGRTSVDGPTIVSASMDGATLKATFSEALKLGSSAALAMNFTIQGAGAVNRGNRRAYHHPSEVALDPADTTNKTLLLKMDPAATATHARPGDDIWLTHEFVDGRHLFDTSDNPAPAFRDFVVTNDTTGTDGPLPVRANVAGFSLLVEFDEDLNSFSDTPGSAFTVETRDADDDRLTLRGTGTAIIPSGPGVPSHQVFVTLDGAAPPEATIVSVTYDKPASNELVDDKTWNRPVRSFEGFKASASHDVMAPKFVNGVINPTGTNTAKAVLYFDEPLDESSVPLASTFRTKRVGGSLTSGMSVTSVAVEGHALVLAGSRPFTGHWYEVTWTPGRNPIQDRAGNRVGGEFWGIKAYLAPKPKFREASVDGATVKVHMHDVLDPGSVPAASAFALWETDIDTTDGNTERKKLPHTRIESVAVQHHLVLLTLNRTVYPCNNNTPFRLSYTVPSTNPLQSVDGQEADAFTADHANNPVTNARRVHCEDWLAGTWPGSVVLEARRAFARNRGEPQPEWFTVRASGGPVAVTGAAFSPDNPKRLKLEVDREFAFGETVTVSYRRPPGTGGLWDVDGNQLRDVANAPVRPRQPAKAGLTAAFHGLPAAHDGSRLFEFEVRFGEAVPGLKLTAFEAGALEVTNGRLVDVRRTVGGRNDSVTVRVRPASQEDVTLTLATTMDCAVASALCASDRRTLAEPVTATVPGPSVNAPATGAPTLAGQARVGGTLTASTDGIADADGLTGAAFAFQWVSSRNGVDTDIAGAAGSTYTPAETDAGAAIKVRVAFTDDAGNAEMLTSAATSPVTLSPLTASFHAMPAEHDGIRRFEFEVRFSEEIAGLRLSAVAGALRVTGGRAVAVKRAVADQIRRVTVQVRPDSAEAVTVALAATTDCSAAGAICAPGGRKLAAVSATVPGPAVNAPATGLPTISGTPQVGGTLTASTAGIADADGLANAAFAFQWVSVRDGTDTDIAGAAASRYTLAATDAGAAIMVRVSFTDDAGNAETLTSAATAPVALPPLTAAFHGIPAEHDGEKRFEFEIRFSEEVAGLRLTAVQAALQVTNGRVVAVKRTAAGKNRNIAVQVRPDGVDDVTIGLPATADCSAAGAICTADGRKLVSALSATVRGPAALSVADAKANEADDAIAFTVSLSRAAAGEVTVNYATRDGTAKAGEDYTFTRGTLTFAAGETSKTVSVPLLDDAIDEGAETFTLKLMNAVGAAIGDGEATGTIENSDPLQKMWLSRFGRTVADHVTGAVSDRLSNPPSGAQVTVGGQSVNLAQTGDGTALTEALTGLARVLGASESPAPDDDGWPETTLGVRESPSLDSAPPRRMSGRELLLGSTFDLAAEREGGAPGLAAWGRVTVGGFDGEAPADGGSDVRIEGEVTTGILGTDAEWDRLLAGVAISVSEGEGTFEQPGVDSGTIESTMTAVSPYARVRVSDRLSAWGLLGFGTGDMTITQAANERGQPERVTRTDIAMRLGAVGGRGALLEAGESGGMDLALKADAFLVETESEPISNEGKTTAQASRVRLVLEGSRAFRMGGGGTLTPGLELGLRHDSGDAETGTGVELGGRIAWSDPSSGISIDSSVRTLIAHEDSGYEEWGASGAVRLAPGASGRGLSFSVAPTWGAPASGAERLWSARDARGLAPDGEFEPERRLEGEMGYGLPAFGGVVSRFSGIEGRRFFSH